MAAEVSKTLNMVFNNSDGKTTAINLVGVNPSVAAADVKTAMTAIISNGIIGDNGVELTSIKSAALVETSKTGVTIV